MSKTTLIPYNFWEHRTIPTIPKDKLSALPYCEGPLDAKVCLVGEAPGAVEERTGRPFVGGSGDLLRLLLNGVNIPPKSCYITNVIKERPPDNKARNWIKENPNAFQQHLRLFAAEMAHVKADIIVPVGGIALEAICGSNKSAITKWRGSITTATLPTLKDRLTIPVIHPAHLMRNWKGLFVTTKLDFKRIKAVLDRHIKGPPDREYIIRPKYEDVVTFIQDIMERIQNPLHNTLISLDTETRFGAIVSIQLSTDPKISITIPFCYRNGLPYFSHSQEVTIWDMLKKLLEHPHAKIIGQNVVSYDLFILWLHGFDWKKLHNNVYMDTRFAMNCYQPQLPAALDYLTSIYTLEPYYKDEGKEWDTRQGEDEFWTYGGKDVCVVSEIAPQQEEDLKRDKLWDFYQEMYMEMSGIQLEMSTNGLLIDEEKKGILDKEYTREILLRQSRLVQTIGRNVNVASSKQMQKLLYEDMKLPKQYGKGADGEYRVTCDRPALLKLLGDTGSEVLEQILRVREVRTLHSNNIKAEYDSDGRLRTSYAFAETGRWTSSKTPLNTGANLQNWNKKMRVMVRADPGYVLLAWDLSQAEARIVAWRARDVNMIGLFESGRDVHRWVASGIFEKPEDEIDHDTERYPAKRTVHGSNYDLQEKRFAASFNEDIFRFNLPLKPLSVARAAFLLNRFHTVVPNVRGVYQKEIREQLETTKRLSNPYGRTVLFLDRIGHELFREGYAWYAQSTCADTTNLILKRSRNEMIDSIKVLNQMHDGALMLVRPNEVKEVVQRIHKIAQLPMMIEGKELIIPIEFSVGDNWMEMENWEMSC